MRNDKTMMMTPMEWPRYPVLPVKRYRNHSFECCIMSVILPFRVYKKSLGGLVKPKIKCKLADLLGDEFYDYQDIDALLADGWLVD